jgi:hypothetical protein
MNAALLVGAIQMVLAAADSQPVSITGVIRDAESTVPLAGVTVVLIDADVPASVTLADGRYLLSGVPAGEHRFVVRAIGYAPRALHILVPAGATLELDLSLDPEPVILAPIEARSPGASGDPRALSGWSDRGVSLLPGRLSPLLAEPDPLQALQGGGVTIAPESPTGLHVQGGAADQIGYLLDGIPVFNPYHAAGMFGAWNPDALSQVDLYSTTATPAGPPALTGTVQATSRASGTRLHTRGGLSSSQARLTVDGPGPGGANFMLSLRSGFPGVIAPKEESSYLDGRIGDGFARLAVPLLGGEVRVLGYRNWNRISSDATAGGDSLPWSRNHFSWYSLSLGMAWQRQFRGAEFGLRAWRALTDAASAWAAPTGLADLTSLRRDDGALAILERRRPGAVSIIGIRIEETQTQYRVTSDSGPRWATGTRALLAGATAEHSGAITAHAGFRVGSTLSLSRSAARVGPQAEFHWNTTDRITLWVRAARHHQFAQSLRNPESVVGNIFPVDLYLGAGAGGLPVARSDQFVLGADYRPAAALHLSGQAYRRRLTGVVLVAPVDGEPFATHGFAVGSGGVQGIGAELAFTTPSLELVARYDWQRVRLTGNGVTYIPEFGASQVLNGGVTVAPTRTLSFRAAMSGAWGRRTTTIPGGFEWESCNLRDRGCEFAGSPHYDQQALGTTRLPAYLRIDLGVRQEWRLLMGQHEARLALYGTMTNVLGRSNLLSYARDGATGPSTGIEMRPRAPLVVGLDWVF